MTTQDRHTTDRHDPGGHATARNGKGKHGAAAGTAELREEVDRARHDLGETVELLAAKADVRAMAREKVARTKERARATAERARDAGPAEQATAGGIVVAAVGAVAMAAVWTRRRRSSGPRWRSAMPTGPSRWSGLGGRHRRRGPLGRRAPVRVQLRSGRRPAVQMRRRRRSIF
ncbi:DUF3618 domain-containing protein [Spirillospora sp. NBC_00431]